MRVVMGAVGRLPYRWLGVLGALVGALVGSVLRIRRAHVTLAMARAGVERPGRAASGMYASLGRGLFELLWLGGRPREEPLRVVIDEASAERFAQALARGRGVVVATAHTGNWDLTACAAAAWIGARAGQRGGGDGGQSRAPGAALRTTFRSDPRGGDGGQSRAPGAAPADPLEGLGGAPHVGARLHVVTKRLSWRALDRTWQHLRAARGIGLIDAHGAARRVLRALGAGDVVAMMVDQVPERGSGVSVLPFLGAPARHDLAPVTLAARAGAPIVVVLGRRAEDGRHVIEVAAVLEPHATREAIIDATAHIARLLEQFVLTYPDQWLWMHRRWKGHSPRRGKNDVRDARVF
jgi:KDO2-lipid IV(A) lauroyltransferase